MATAALLAIGTGLSVAGQYQQARYAKAEGEYNAQVAERNAQLAEQETQYNIEKRRREAISKRGSQVAAFGASGVALTPGTSVESILANTMYQAELDVMNIERTGSIEASGYRSEGAASRLRGEGAYSTGLLKAGGTALTGASSLTKRLPTKKK
jgi:hypothetical protein